MINLTILSLQQTIFEGNIQSLTLPGKQGELTILPNHLPIITPLKTGVISAVVGKGGGYQLEERKYFECDGGILEFSDNKATVLM